ncbi:MAG: Nif3-like dinuclear metal center hexameric protein [Bacteroidales bacterium]|jgi:dinuclear metal center YbgI/SA1388 family protein
MMVFVNDIVTAIESLAPSGLQEPYDNSGLLTGRGDQQVTGILVCLDVIPDIMDEAEKKGCNMIISHHPPFFSGMKRFTGDSMPEEILIRAIRSGLILYSCHTNLDSVIGGVSGKMAAKLGLINQKILVPREDDLLKLVCFIPASHLEMVSQAIFAAGAGSIGKYDHCSFQVSGNGTFKAGTGAKPYTGIIGTVHYEPETRFETILPKHCLKKVLKAMLDTHPYEEVAYDLYPLVNANPAYGLGISGDLENPCGEKELLKKVKEVFGLPVVRHSQLRNKEIKRVALCGGSGIQFIKEAIFSGADIYLTADIKYHSWFEVPHNFILADIGHFESEQFAINLLADSLIENFPKFAVYLTEVNTNPINYFL